MNDSVAIIWNLDVPELAVWNMSLGFDGLRHAAEQKFQMTDIAIFVIYEDVRLKVTEQNYEAIRLLKCTVILDVTPIDEEDNSSDGESVHEKSTKKKQLDLDATIHCNDLSKMNVTYSTSGSRWTDAEEAYLKNFFKYSSRRNIEKPTLQNLNAWIVKRKSSFETLFGSRSEAAVLAHYKKMITLGDMKNLHKRT